MPTTVELGFPDTDYNLWVGAFVSAKTPADLVQRLHREFNATLESVDLRDRLQKIGAEARPMPMPEFQTLVARELASNAKLFTAIGLKPK